jgi:hypothetical protein
VLEVLVHLDKVEIPGDYVLMGLEIANTGIPHVTEADARQISLGKSQPALRVSSFVVPREANYILYPEAPGLAATVLFTEPFAFDARLFAPTRII